MGNGINSKGLPIPREVARNDPRTDRPTDRPSSVGAGGTFRGETLDERLRAAEAAAERARLVAELAVEEAREKAKKAHNFWTKPYQAYDPKAQFRVIVRIPGMALEDGRLSNVGDEFADTKDQSGDTLWYVKSCDKPGYTVDELHKDEYMNVNLKINPTPLSKTPTFKEVNMTFIDPVYPNVTRKLARFLRRGGYNDKLADAAAQKLGGNSNSYVLTAGADGGRGNYGIPRVEIIQLDRAGNEIETWTLIDAYPASVDWGKLDYSSDDLVEISVTWRYKTFTLKAPAIGNEEAFEYFKDIGSFKTPDTGTESNPCKSVLYRAKNRKECQEK